MNALRTWALALAMTVSAVLAPMASAASFLADLAGDWTGRGTIRERPDAGPERGFCKIAVRGADDRGAFRISGRCAGARGSAIVSVEFLRIGRRVSAVVTSPALEGTAVYAGRESGRRITLDSRAPRTIDGRAYQSTIEILFGSIKRFEMNETLTDLANGKRLSTLKMSFSRDAAGR